MIIVCCVGLAVWTGVLARDPAAVLPGRQGGAGPGWASTSRCSLAFAATGWAAWRRSQLLIICLVVLATLLCCDAWFDVVLDAHTKGFWLSLLSALIMELPLALSAIIGARRLLRLTIGMVSLREGYPGPVPPLWQVPLLGAARGAAARPARAGPTARPRGPEAGLAGGVSLTTRMSSACRESAPGRPSPWRSGRSSRGQRGGDVGVPEGEARRDRAAGDPRAARAGHWTAPRART